MLHWHFSGIVYPDGPNSGRLLSKTPSSPGYLLHLHHFIADVYFIQWKEGGQGKLSILVQGYVIGSENSALVAEIKRNSIPSLITQRGLADGFSIYIHLYPGWKSKRREGRNSFLNMVRIWGAFSIKEFISRRWRKEGKEKSDNEKFPFSALGWKERLDGSKDGKDGNSLFCTVHQEGNTFDSM